MTIMRDKPLRNSAAMQALGARFDVFAIFGRIPHQRYALSLEPARHGATMIFARQPRGASPPRTGSTHLSPARERTMERKLGIAMVGILVLVVALGLYFSHAH